MYVCMHICIVLLCIVHLLYLTHPHSFLSTSIILLFIHTFIAYYYRLKASEVDRARCKARLAALKDKVLDLEAELRDTVKERDRLVALVADHEVLKASVGRKEVIIKSFKVEMQRLRAEGNKLVTDRDEKVIEADKKIR